MSDRRIGFFIAMAALVAVALFSVAYADISSAEPGDFEEAPSERTGGEMQLGAGSMFGTSPQADGLMGGPAQQTRTVMIDPGAQQKDQMGFIHDFERISVEKKELESKGMNVVIRDITPAPDNSDIYAAVKELIGEDSFVDVSVDDGTVEEVVSLSEIDEASVDDGFLTGLADALEDTSPEVSAMIRAVLDMRSRMSSVGLLQELVCCASSASERKAGDTESDEDAEENEVVVIDESKDTEEAAPIVPVPAVPYASCGADCPVVAAVFAAECCHGAADGPAL